jgi:hypothetical protein
LEEQGPRRRGAAPPDVGSLCARFFFLGWMEPDRDGDDVIWGTVGQAAAAAAADENLRRWLVGRSRPFGHLGRPLSESSRGPFNFPYWLSFRGTYGLETQE